MGRLRLLLGSTTVLALSMLGLVGLGPAMPARAAGSSALPYSVYVGYVDTTRPNPVNFPTPWSGSPNVLPFSDDGTCSSNCDYDGGAIELVNTSGSTDTVSSFSVAFGSCVFNLWNSTLGSGVSLPPGDEMMFAQTAGGSSSGCATNGTFDTSDVGPNGANWASNCTQSGVVPQVSVTVNGTPSTFADTGQVLNTGGFDKGACSALNANPQPYIYNESQQWTPIGDSACTNPQLTLAPATGQSVAPGGTATFTATFSDSCKAVGSTHAVKNPIPGVAVTLTVNSGPNAGATQSSQTGTTGRKGTATLSYTGSNFGIDTVTASAANDAGTIYSNSANVFWQTATLTLGSSSGLPGTTVTFSGSGYASGETVNLYLGTSSGAATSGTFLTSAMASSTGTISGSFVTPTPAGGPPATAVVAVGKTSGREGWAIFNASCSTDWNNTAGGNFGTASDWTGGSVPGTSDLACIILPGTYTVTQTGGNTVGGLVVGSGNTSSGGTQTLELAGGNDNLSLDGPGVINPGGVFSMDSTDGNSSVVSGSGTLTNNGTFRTLEDNGSQRYIRVNLVNGPSGTVTLNDFDNRLDSGNTITNHGTFTVGSTAGLSVTNGSSFVQAAGKLTVPTDGLYVGGSYLTDSGGTVKGTAVLNGSTLADSGGGGTFILECGDSLSGTVSSSQVVDVQGNGCGSATTTIQGVALTNNGTLELDSTNGNPAYLQGSPLVNNGSFDVLQDNGGARYIQVGVTNSSTGTTTVGDFQTYVNSGSTFVNSGTMTTVAPSGGYSGGALYLSNGSNFDQSGGTLTNGGILSINGGTFDFGGGSTSGNQLVLDNTTLDDNSTGAAAFALRDTTNLVESNLDGNGNLTIPAGQVLDLQDVCQGIAYLDAAHNLDISGTLESSNAGTCGGYNIRINTGLDVLSGGTFTFAAPVAGNGGTDTVGGPLDVNAGGLANIDYTIAVSGAVTDNGTLDVGAGGTLSLSSSYTQGSKASLGVTVNANGSSYGIAANGQSVTLAGALSASAVGTASSGTAFDVLTGASPLSGSFSSTPAGYSVSYSNGAVVLTKT